MADPSGLCVGFVLSRSGTESLWVEYSTPYPVVDSFLWFVEILVSEPSRFMAVLSKVLRVFWRY